MYDRSKVAAYVAALIYAPAPAESVATLASVRAAVLEVTRAYGDAPVFMSHRAPVTFGRKVSA